MTKAQISSRAAVSKDGVRVNVTGRRTYSEAYKRAVVKECLAPNVSVAAIGLKHGINDNLLRRWVRAQQSTATTPATPVLLPVKMDMEHSRREPLETEATLADRADSGGCIEIDIGRVRIRVRGAVDANALRCVLNELRRS